MNCPECAYSKNKVIETRTAKAPKGYTVKLGEVLRIRECQRCHHRFKTSETIVRERHHAR